MATPNFIKEPDFVGQIDLSFCDGFPLDFAAQQEKQTLIDLLGYHLYADIVDSPTTPKYIDLMEGIEWVDSSSVTQYQEGMTKVAEYFFYYHYLKEMEGQQTPKGMIAPDRDSGEPSLKW